MIDVAAGVMLDVPPRTTAEKGVTGFDSERLIRGSVPRKATMISKTTRRKV